jgi:hypothetical protein
MNLGPVRSGIQSAPSPIIAQFEIILPASQLTKPTSVLGKINEQLPIVQVDKVISVRCLMMMILRTYFVKY